MATVQEMIDELSEALAIDAIDGNLTDAEQAIIAKLHKQIDEEVARQGHVTVTLTPEQLAMPWEEFFAQIIQRHQAN